MGKFNTRKLQRLIIQHIKLLEKKINHYLPSLTKSADWSLLLFYFNDNLNELDLTNKEKMS